MKVKDACTKDVQIVSPGTPLTEVAKMMKDHDCGSILVAEGDRLTGVVTDRDIILRSLAESRNPMNMTAGECKTDEVLYCYENDDVEDVLRNMGDNAIRRLPVLNEDKRLVGIVSFGDLSACCEHKDVAGKAMEEIREAA